MEDPIRAKEDQRWNEDMELSVAAEKVEREHAVIGRKKLVPTIEALLFDVDPMGINFGDNTDEYHAEAQSIVIRLPTATCQGDVRQIVYEVFVHWFDQDMVGGAEDYENVATNIWDLWTAL